MDGWAHGRCGAEFRESGGRALLGQRLEWPMSYNATGLFTPKEGICGDGGACVQWLCA